MKRVKQKNGRDKAFIGAIVGGVASIAGGIINAEKQKKADKLAFEQAQAEQTRIEGVQQAQAMTASYANQDYVNEYQNKITLKNGGKVKIKKSNSNDRIVAANKFKMGGRKALFGAEVGSFGQEAGAAAGGIGGLVTSFFSKPTAPKMIKKADGFNYAAPKTGITPNSYQVDENGQPIVTANTGELVTSELIPPPPLVPRAKYGTRKRVKTK